MNENMNITKEVNMVWNIANKLRGAYKSDEYKSVIIPMVIIRRFECALAKTKNEVIKEYEADKTVPEKILCDKSHYSFYNTSHFDLKELLNDSKHIAANFKSYINGFSSNVKTILLKDGLNFEPEIDKMAKNQRLLGVIKEFSNLDLDPETVDNHKMGYIFEDIIRRFSENAKAGEHFTPREVISLMVKILLSENCDDLATPGKTVTVLDAACGTGGMLSTARNEILKLNPTADVELFGQEVNPESYGICLADMLIKGQDAKNIRFQDTMKKDCFDETPDKREQKMRFVIMNPPFGEVWGGEHAADGVEDAVRKEYEKGFAGRFGAGLPGTSDMQLLFMQHGISKLDNDGRAAIITDGSPLFSGGTSSGESQIRRWMIEQDLIEAIISLPTDLFYNTGIGIYVFILSKPHAKSLKRRNKIQLINASSDKFYTVLQKSLGKKRKEISSLQIQKIVDLYANFEENEYSKIYDKEEFLYREYTIYQPMQRSYGITKERIEKLQKQRYLDNFYSQSKLENLKLIDPLSEKQEKDLAKLTTNKIIYENIFQILNDNISSDIFLNKEEFEKILKNILKKLDLKKNVFDNIVNGLSIMDKSADIEHDRKGNIILDPDTKDSEIVKYSINIDDYMKSNVLPYLPDAIAKFEEDLTAKKPIIKIGAEFPFRRYFYEYHAPEESEKLEQEFIELEKSIDEKIQKLFREV